MKAYSVFVHITFLIIHRSMGTRVFATSPKNQRPGVTVPTVIKILKKRCKININLSCK